jgi:hypothetical protein
MPSSGESSATRSVTVKAHALDGLAVVGIVVRVVGDGELRGGERHAGNLARGQVVGDGFAIEPGGLRRVHLWSLASLLRRRLRTAYRFRGPRRRWWNPACRGRGRAWLRPRCAGSARDSPTSRRSDRRTRRDASSASGPRSSFCGLKPNTSSARCDCKVPGCFGYCSACTGPVRPASFHCVPARACS